MSYKLLGVNADAKTSKGTGKGYLTGILYLAPHKISGRNLCPYADGCEKACLYTAGRGAFNNVQQARIRKAQLFITDQTWFKTLLVADIIKLRRSALAKGLTPVVRLNGTPDIPWENVRIGDAANIMTLFPDVQFYDYTKNPNRRGLPANYHLTFSFSGHNHAASAKAFADGLNLAVVFHGSIPRTWAGIPVINGDLDDLRFNDPAGVIVGLTAKGQAKRDVSGFVQIQDINQAA